LKPFSAYLIAGVANSSDLIFSSKGSKRVYLLVPSLFSSAPCSIFLSVTADCCDCARLVSLP